MIARLKTCHAGAGFGDDADAFMAQDASRRAARDIAFQDVQVGAADRGLGDLDDGVGRAPMRGIGRSSSAFCPGP